MRSPHKRVRISKPAEERLDDLLRAALEVFSERGISAATVEEITERADVSKGTFYLYFESKDHAVGQLWQRYVEGFLQICEGILADQKLAALPRLKKVFRELTKYAFANGKLHKLVYSTADAEALEYCRTSNEKVIKTIAGFVRQGVADHTLWSEQPELVTRTLFLGIDGALHDAIMSGSKNQAVLIETAGSLAEANFGPRPGAQPRSRANRKRAD